jgi:hypothetical protein
MSHEVPKRIYKTMQGKEIDINRIISQNETTIAVGNVRANARGDMLGPGGKIIPQQEESLRSTPTRKRRINQEGFVTTPPITTTVIEEKPIPIPVKQTSKQTKDTPIETKENT